MGQAIGVRGDFKAGEVRRLAKRARDVGQARRLLAIAAVLDGASRAEAAKVGGMDRQTLRDWVIRFNEHGPDGLINPGAHAIIILDQAGWHGAKQLKIPHNISLLPLPPRSPELNSQENIWQFMRQNWLSNRVFKSFDDIVDPAATPGTPPSINLGRSCPSLVANGHSSINDREVWYKWLLSAQANAASKASAPSS
ncbi:transposase [Bradyrhizobium sp. JR3.5]